MQDVLRENWLTLGVLAVIVGVLGFGVTEDAAVSRRVFRRFFLNIAAPLAVLFLPLILWAATADVDPRVMQAVVAGLVIAAGWLTTAIFGELEKARGRSERLRDYHKAIYAEIRDTLAAFYSEGQAEAQGRATLDRMAAEPDFVPFIPKEHHDRIFAALVEDIEVLPRQTIDAVVAYYSVIGSITALAEDMRSENYSDLPQARRIPIYEDYGQMRLRAYQLGSYALELIDAYAKGGATAADAVTERFNIPDAVPIGPSRGSE